MKEIRGMAGIVACVVVGIWAYNKLVAKVSA